MNQGPKGTNMTKIQVYDPALCCSTGICGVDVDQEKVAFAADVDWLKSQEGGHRAFQSGPTTDGFC